MQGEVDDLKAVKSFSFKVKQQNEHHNTHVLTIITLSICSGPTCYSFPTPSVRLCYTLQTLSTLTGRSQCYCSFSSFFLRSLRN